MDADLVIGCHGHRWYGISMCKGTTNTVVDLRKLGSSSEEILNHLDKHYKIFDKVIDDNNQVNNILNFLSKYSILPDHLMKVFNTYLGMHRGCGIFIFVDPHKQESK